MLTIKNTTNEHICIQVGRDSHEYVQYHLYPLGSTRKDQPDTLTVTKKEAKKIVARIKEVHIVGVIVSDLLEEPLKVIEDESAEAVEASVEVTTAGEEEAEEASSEVVEPREEASAEVAEVE